MWPREGAGLVPASSARSRIPYAAPVPLTAAGEPTTLPQTRVRGLDVLGLPPVGPCATVSLDRRWRNGASYDDIASGSTQFLSRDPMVATTRSPYGYVDGNPLNRTDPSGMFLGVDTCDWCGEAASDIGDAGQWAWDHAPVHNWRQPITALLLTADTLTVLTADVGAIAAPFIIAPLCGPAAPWCAAGAVALISAPILSGSYAYFRYLLPAEVNEAFGGSSDTAGGGPASSYIHLSCS